MGLWYGSLFCLILGTASLIIGYILRQIQNSRRVWSGHTTGKVVELVLRPGETPQGQFRDRYYPVIEFYARGKLYRVEGPQGSWPSIYTVNQEVLIDYDVNEPAAFQIGTKDIFSYLPTILYGVGTVLLLTSAVVFLKYALRI